MRCEGLPHRIPSGLYLESKTHVSGDPVQGEDGVLKWARRYRLTEGSSEITSSESYFKVMTTSVVRFFVDTIHTGALVKYRLFDGDDQQIFSSHAVPGSLDGFTDSSAEIAIVHRPEGKKVQDAPYYLQLEYQHSGLGSGSQDSMTGIGSTDKGRDDDYLGFGDDEDEKCPAVDIRLLVEPLETARQSLRCSDIERRNADKPRLMKDDYNTK